MPKEDTQFKKGNPGGPGRPKGSGLSLTTLLKRHLEKVPEGQKETYADLFIKTLMKKAIVEKDQQSLKLIMNYVDGLPTQKIENDVILKTYKWLDYGEHNNIQTEEMDKDTTRD